VIWTWIIDDKWIDILYDLNSSGILIDYDDVDHDAAKMLAQSLCDALNNSGLVLVSSFNKPHWH
jgi:hypothetical protein